MRKLWIALAVLLPLFAIGFYVSGIISQQAPTWRYTLSGTAGTLLYATAFDDTFADEWEQAQGRESAELIDGALRVSIGVDGDGVFAPALPDFTDFDVSVDALPLEGPIDNGFGVLFRLQDPANYYALFISSDGYYKIERVVNGIARDISTWIPSDALRVVDDANGSFTVDADEAQPNTLRVVARGDTFRFYVNGTPLELCIPNESDGKSTYVAGACVEGTMRAELTDASHASGRIALGAVTTATGGAGVVVAFDNLLVYAPSDE